MLNGKFNKDAAFRRNFLCCDHQNIFSHTTRRHKPVRSTSLRESPFLHTDAWESANSFWAIISSLVLLKSTNSHLFYSTGFFFLFFSTHRWVKRERKKIQTKRFCPVQYWIFPFHCRANAPRLVATLSVCGRNSFQVRLITWADDSSAITYLFKKLLFSWEASVKHSSEWPNPAPHLLHSARTSLLSLWLFLPPPPLHSLSLSPFSCCGEQHNCQLCMG